MKATYTYAFTVLLFTICFSGCKKEEGEPAPVGPEVIDFGSHAFGSMQDGEGNVYKTIVIGANTWMAENLKVTKSNTGEVIPAVGTGTTWTSTNAPAYHDATEASIGVYGRLYNAAASKNACPIGWHLPSSVEWEAMATTLGGKSVAGGKMKEKGINHWAAPNTDADNSSGFTGLPAGSIHLGALRDRALDGYWWSNDQITFYYISSSLATLRTKSTATAQSGLAIRCVKD